MGTFSFTSDGGITGLDSAMTFGHLTGAADPVSFVWTFDSIQEGAEIAVGLSDPSGTIYGAGLRNLLYISSGRIVVNGVDYASVPPFGAGDRVELIYDGVAGYADWLLNGEYVA
jgi:hypothetical protein